MLDFKFINQDTLKPHFNGQPMPFLITKGNGCMMLEATGSSFTMRPQRFTKVESLKTFLIDAHAFLTVR